MDQIVLMGTHHEPSIMSDNKSSITDLRDRIDTIDSEVVGLLKERLECAVAIGKLKDAGKRAAWDPYRERQIYERLAEINDGGFPENALRSIFHEIITTCRLSQKKIEISYLGPEATFTHLAGVSYFGQSAEYRPLESIAEVFAEVEKERHHLRSGTSGKFYRGRRLLHPGLVHEVQGENLWGSTPGD